VKTLNACTSLEQWHKKRVVLQIHRQFRKPLLVVAPKNLLRHPDAKSGLWEFDDKADDKGILGVRFKRLIMDASAEDRSEHTLVIASLSQAWLMSDGAGLC
jgi:2-oxoglutarate dehydrogenase E1 component